MNGIRDQYRFDLVVLSQDFHPANHCSFYENNKSNAKAKLNQELELPEIGLQMMWPVHCVQNTKGCEFIDGLKRKNTDIIVPKGQNPKIDSYSAFFDNNHLKQTDLEKILRSAGITDCFLCGVAADYCVGYSCLDSFGAGFSTYMVFVLFVNQYYCRLKMQLKELRR